MTKSTTAQEFHIAVSDDGSRALDLLAGASSLSRQRLKHAMGSGAVWLERGRQVRRLRRNSRTLKAGDELHLYYNPAVLDERPPAARLVADRGDYSAWNKPFGMRSQGSKWGDHCAITRYAETFFEPQRTSFTVHRLDRAANGLILVAHNKRAAAALSRLFRERRIDKHYSVIVEGVTGDRACIDAPLDGKPAVTRFARLADDGERSLLDVVIESGRKHQVRRHLAALGHPVVGDRLYGTAGDGDEDLRLRAVTLAFDCPLTGEPVRIELSPYTLS